MKRIAVCAALPLELESLSTRLKAPLPSSGRRWVRATVSPKLEVWLIASGVGHACMKRVLKTLPDEPVDLWVSFGLAGGLSPDLKEGDACTGARVFFEQEVLVNAVEEDNALLYCSHQALLTPEAKQEAFSQTGAVAVDMESGEVARVAQSRNEAFEWMRVISDTANDRLNPALMDCIGRNGYPGIWASILVLLRQPWVLPELLEMDKKTRRLSQSLADTLQKRLDTLTTQE